MTAPSPQLTTLVDVFTDVLPRELHLPAHLAEGIADALVIGATTIPTQARAVSPKAGSCRLSLNCSATTRRGLHQI